MYFQNQLGVSFFFLLNLSSQWLVLDVCLPYLSCSFLLSSAGIAVVTGQNSLEFI